MAVRVGVLGPITVEAGAAPAELRRPQVRQLLALLAAAGGGTVPTNVLEDDLWPDRLPQSPRAALHVVVNRARQVLGSTGKDILVSAADGYRLEVGLCEIDLLTWRAHVGDAQKRARVNDVPGALEAYAAARDLWRGAPFADVESSERLDQERRTLEIAAVDAEVAELELMVSTGRFPAAAGRATALVQRDLLREDLVVAALRALDGAGRRAEALQAAARFRQRLRDELGLSPSPRFDAAELAVLAGSPAGAIDDPATAAERSGASVHGRDAERSLLDSVVERGIRGDGGVVVVTGEPGAGVTSLLTDLAGRWIDRGGPHVHLVTGGDGPSHSLRTMLGMAAPLPAEGRRSEHLRAREALAELAGDAGLVLVVDDAHLLDEWSMSLLVSLAGACPPGVAVVAGHAAAGDGGRPTGLLEPLDARATLVELAPLDEEALRAVVHERWPQLAMAAVHRWAAHLERWCGGNPMWTNEVLEGADPADDPAELRTVPLSAEATVRRRVAQLPAPARELLRVAAVLGPEVDLQVVAVVADEPVDVVVSLLSQTTVVDALVPTNRAGRWRFRHELVQRAIAGSVGPGDFAAWNATAGRYLREVAGRRHEAARHLVQAVPLVSPDDARAAAVAAARELRSQGSHAEAADLYREAANLATSPADRYAAWLGEAEAAEQLGDRARAGRRYDEVIAACADGSEPDLLAAAALGSTSHASAVGGRNDRRSRLRMAWRRLDQQHPQFDTLAVELALELRNARQSLELDLADHVRRVAANPSSPAHLLARRFCLADDEIDGRGSVGDAAALAAAALVPGAAPPFVASACLAVSVGVALAAGAWDRAEDWIDEMALLGVTSGEPRARWQSLAFRAVLLDARGELLEADQAASEARVVGENLDMGDAAATHALYQLGQAYRGGSLAVLAPILAMAEERYRFPIWTTLRGLAELDAGNTAEAGALLRTSFPSGLRERYHFRSATIATGALLAARLADGDLLATLVPELERAGDRFVMLGYGGPCLGPVAWYRAEAAAAAGCRSEADQLMALAVDRCGAVGARAWSVALGGPGMPLSGPR